MATLYNMAASHGGLVAGTDNYSELTAGFWTLHGDVGDISPIQSLLKSWEVPYLAKSLGVPRSDLGRDADRRIGDRRHGRAADRRVISGMGHHGGGIAGGS